jgi:hypothetical protein
MDNQNMSKSFEWIDDAFHVEKTGWGTWRSFNKEEKILITSLTQEVCIHATRFYLKGLQEGWDDNHTKYDKKFEYKL